MKRLLSLLLCVSLSLLLVACGGNNYGNGVQRKAGVKGRQNAPLNALANGDPEPLTYPQQVAALLTEYVGENKQYTKLTRLNYDSTATNYHAGVNNQLRRTYYDEKNNALLMGDYEGTFTTINSGYAKSGDNMVHYSNNAGESISLSNLFTARDENYTVYNSDPVAYFDVLSEIATLIGGLQNTDNWTCTDGVYTYTAPAPAQIQDSSNYTDGLLKMLQYFAAPMLLLNNNIGLLKAKFMERDAYIGSTLSKVLYIELIDNSGAEVSHAIVAKGLTFDSVLLVDANLVYLNANIWDVDNAWFAAYFFIGESTKTWVKMEHVGNRVYVAEIPSEYRLNEANVIFVRMNPANNELDWNSRYGSNDQTYDLSLNNHFGMTYKIDEWTTGNQGKAGGVWY